MRRVEGQCLVDVRQRRSGVLLRQTNHQIQIERVKVLGGRFNGGDSLGTIMNTPQGVQALVVKTLDA